jgi:hypothetical protein
MNSFQKQIQDKVLTKTKKLIKTKNKELVQASKDFALDKISESELVEKFSIILQTRIKGFWENPGEHQLSLSAYTGYITRDSIYTRIRIAFGEHNSNFNRDLFMVELESEL